MRPALLALLIAFPLAAQQPARPHAPRQASSPALPVDTAVHVGHLANGLRYWIRHNNYPEHRLELRLVIRAGSILEDNDQRGLAHFIEHMGFNGTAHFAKNEMVKYLESIGVKYGADLNANTSFDETQYILPVPSDKPELVARAFDILQDWASGDKFDPDEVTSERGVVLNEWRGGLGVSSRIINQEIPVLFKGSRYAVRLPIGDTGIITHATAAPMKRFYHDWYRPDLMGIVAVGDYPVDSIAALIKSRFATMRNPAKERPRTDAPVPSVAGTRMIAIADPEQPTEAIELLVRRPTTHYRTEADERRDVVTSLFSIIAAQRLQELRRRPDVPFVGANFGPSGFIRDLQVFQVGVSPKEGKGAAAFETALRELRRLDEHGVLPTELDRAKASLLRGRESAAAEEGKTESYVYVEAYINAFLRGETLVSAGDRYALAKKILPTVTIAEVNAAIREASQGDDRFILVLGPEKAKSALPTRDTLLAILARTDTMTLPAWTETSVAAVLVPNPPRPGRIVSETTHADVGVTDWRFSNGVRVLIKPTDFKADEVQMTGEAAGGLSLLPDNQLTNGGFAAAVVRQSGAGDFDAPALQRKLSGKIVRVVPAIDETSEGMIVLSAPRDLETALQVLWLNATAPRLDSAAVAALTNQARNGLKNRDAEPGTAFSDTITITLGRNSPRAQPMTAARLDAEFDPRRALAIYRDWFHSFGDFTFVLVGNVNVDSLRPLLSQWLGGLPATGTARTWKDVAPVPPEGLITKTVRKGKEPVAEQVVLFSGPVERPATETDDAAAAAAAEIIQERLLDQLREAMGATYGVDANTIIERVPRRRYRTLVEFKSSPQQADTLWSAAQAIITAFRADGPRPDEVQKFVAQARRETEVQVKTNDWWLGRLSDYVMPDGGEAGRPISEILQWGQRLDALTPMMIRDAARRYFDPSRVARFVLLPEK
jgi:zinc protease